MNAKKSVYGRLLNVLELIPYWFVALMARFYVSYAFFNSALTKIVGWNPFDLQSSAIFLFRQEYKLHILGGEYSMPFPEFMARFAALGEFCLPILVMLGLFARFGAFGLLIMTGVIQLVYPEAWAGFHLPWAVALLLVMAKGPGIVSLDHLLGLDRKR